MSEETKPEVTAEDIKQFLFGTFMDSFLEGFTVYMNKLMELELPTNELLQEVVTVIGTMQAEAAQGLFIKMEDKIIFTDHIQVLAKNVIEHLQAHKDDKPEQDETVTESGIVL